MFQYCPILRYLEVNFLNFFGVSTGTPELNPSSIKFSGFFKVVLVFDCTQVHLIESVIKNVDCVYETVSCMQQLCVLCIVHLLLCMCFLMMPAQNIQLCPMQSTISSTLIYRLLFLTDSTR